MAKKKDKPDLGLKKNLVPIEDFLKFRKQTFMSVWASTGMGKSHFILTAPPPIFLLSFEPDGPYWALRRALKAGLVESGDVFVDEVIRSALGSDASLVRSLEDEQEIYYYVHEQVKSIMSQNNEGTIAFDTASTYWTMTDEVEGEAIRAKRAKQGKDLYRFDFRYANRAFKHMTDALRASNLNIIFTHHDKAHYNSQGNATKKREYSGNNQLPDWVDIHLRLRYSPDFDKDGERRWATVEKSRLDNSLLGEEIENPTFGTVLEVLTPE